MCKQHLIQSAQFRKIARYSGRVFTIELIASRRTALLLAPTHSSSVRAQSPKLTLGSVNHRAGHNTPALLVGAQKYRPCCGFTHIAGPRIKCLYKVRQDTSLAFSVTPSTARTSQAIHSTEPKQSQIIRSRSNFKSILFLIALAMAEVASLYNSLPTLGEADE